MVQGWAVKEVLVGVLVHDPTDNTVEAGNVKVDATLVTVAVTVEVLLVQQQSQVSC